MFKAYSRFLDRLEKLFLMILGLLLAAMTGIMVYQVVLRYLFHRPNVWAEEVVKFLFAWVCFVEYVLQQPPEGGFSAAEAAGEHPVFVAVGDRSA